MPLKKICLEENGLGEQWQRDQETLPNILRNVMLLRLGYFRNGAMKLEKINRVKILKFVNRLDLSFQEEKGEREEGRVGTKEMLLLKTRLI